MIRTFEFDDIAAVEASLKNLRRYNQAMYISVDEKLIDNDLAELYFRAEEGSKEEVAIEKMIGAAAIQVCNDNPDIPQKYKQQVGNRMQREFLSAFRASKVDFFYHSGKFGMPRVTSSMENLENTATPFHDFWPKTRMLYPYSSNKLCGKLALSTFNSWTKTVSYSPPRRMLIKLSAWARIELMFNVSIFIFAIFSLVDII